MQDIVNATEEGRYIGGVRDKSAPTENSMIASPRLFADSFFRDYDADTCKCE
jgi:hypothetical protein